MNHHNGHASQSVNPFTLPNQALPGKVRLYSVVVILELPHMKKFLFSHGINAEHNWSICYYAAVQLTVVRTK